MAILLTKGQSGPEGLVADRLTDDLGTVRQGTERSVSFRVTNRFRRTMTIREIQTGCSCMSSSTDERVIPSGATTEIRIRWSAGVRSGPHDDAITILYALNGDSTNRRSELTIRADIQPEYEVSPVSIDFDRYNNDIAIRFTPRLSSVAIRSWEIDLDGIEIKRDKHDPLILHASRTDRGPIRSFRKGTLTIFTDSAIRPVIRLPAFLTPWTEESSSPNHSGVTP
jgi:hypothetical protein